MAKNRKASALIISLLILSMMLIIGLSVSLTAVKEQKSAIESEKSGIAYQIAESGVENVMEKLLSSYPTNPKLDFIGCSVVEGDIIKGTSNDGEYKVYFYEMNPLGNEVLTNCNANVSEVTRIKSVGAFNNVMRAIEAPVIFSP